jgi:hypothetical protein
MIAEKLVETILKETIVANRGTVPTVAWRD